LPTIFSGMYKRAPDFLKKAILPKPFILTSPPLFPVSLALLSLKIINYTSYIYILRMFYMNFTYITMCCKKLILLSNLNIEASPLGRLN
jgi:hypothetical protein